MNWRGSGWTLPGDAGANAGAKVMSLVAGMAAGADTIDGMDVLRHGATARADLLPGIDQGCLIDIDEAPLSNREHRTHHRAGRPAWKHRT